MRITRKIGKLVRSFALWMKEGTTITKTRTSKGAPAFTKWNVARVLALAALVSVGGAMYFNLASGVAPDTAATESALEARQVECWPEVDICFPIEGEAAYLDVVDQAHAAIDRAVGGSRTGVATYGEQRAAGSLEERLEVRRFLTEASSDAKANGKKHSFGMAEVRHYENHEGWELNEAFEARGLSTLVRTPDRVIATLQTTGLEPGAWTMWWIFYNDPTACQNPILDPDGNELSQCSRKDRVNPDVGRSPGWGSSSVVGENGIGSFAAVKDVGMDAAGSPRDVNLCCPVVTNPMGAEIHILMRYHGPVAEDDAGLLLDQLFTWGGGCDYDPALNRGTAGEFDCFDPAMSVHQGSPRQDSEEKDGD